MSEYCKYCDSLTNATVKVHNEKGVLVWVGCINCYQEKIKKDAGAK